MPEEDITLTPNIGLKKPDDKYQNWDEPLRDNYDILDAIIGKVTDVGNYDETTRPSLAGIIGSETGLGDQTLIAAIVANRTDIDQNIIDISALQSALTPAGLNSFDSNPTYKLSGAIDLVEAINWLDGLNFEELNPSGATVSRFGADTIPASILTFNATAGSGTPVGVGSLRWHQGRSAFGVQFFGQTAEGNEVVVTGDIDDVVIFGHDGIGSIGIDIANYATLLTMPDTLQQFSLSSSIVELQDDVLIYDGLPLCAAYDPSEDQWHFAFHDNAVQNFPVLTVTNGGGANGAKVETNYGAGFSNGVKLYYVSIKGQDTTAQAFLGYFRAFLNNLSLFTDGTLQTSVFTNNETSVKGAIEYIDTVGVSGGPWTLAAKQTIGADVTLNFGAATGESIKWDNTAGQFTVSNNSFVDGILNATGTITSDTGSVQAEISVTAVTGDLLAPAGKVEVAGNIISTGGNLDISGGTGLILTDGHPAGIDPDLYWDAVDDDYVVQSDGSPKIGTRNTKWKIGENLDTEDVKLEANYQVPGTAPFITQVPYLVYDRTQRRWMGQNGDGNPDFELGGGGADHDALNNLAWSLAGHTMDATLDMNDNSIFDIPFLMGTGTSLNLATGIGPNTISSVHGRMSIDTTEMGINIREGTFATSDIRGMALRINYDSGTPTNSGMKLIYRDSAMSVDRYAFTFLHDGRIDFDIPDSGDPDVVYGASLVPISTVGGDTPNVWTLPDKSGTVAMLSDTGGGDFTTLQNLAQASNFVHDSFAGSVANAARWEYVVKDGVNLRTGTILATWDGTLVSSTEFSTTSLGTTTGITFTVAYNGSNIELQVVITGGTWDVDSKRLQIG